jgi:hypothetical protein
MPRNPTASKPGREDGQPQPVAAGDLGFHYPKLVLEGKLARIFTVSECKYISGLTCHIRYNGVLPLPSQVFFTEFDESGRQAGLRVRLIYPKLRRGETGLATFRIRTGSPAKVVITGEWKGPWRNSD